MKYRRDIGLGEALTPQFSQFAVGLEWSAELVVPVPLGQKRLRERGYNQAEILARPLALAMGLGYAPDALFRVRDTRSQVGLSRRERQDNVRGAFRSKANLVSRHSILLVDDVATTGATISSCAEALMAAGAHEVSAVTVARAVPRGVPRADAAQNPISSQTTTETLKETGDY